MNVNNKKIIKKLTWRTVKSNKTRNIVAIIAIALTATMFTTIFAIGGNILESFQDTTMRQVGTSSHGGLKYLTQEQYDNFEKSPLIDDISYNIIIAVAENEELRKNQTEIRWSEDKCAEWGFSFPTTGDMPRSGKEIAMSTITLDLLGIPHELGQTVPLEFTVDGKKYNEEFILSGYWKGDGVMAAQQVYLSREYTDSLVTIKGEFNWDKGAFDAISGTISADVRFKNTFNIEEKMKNLVAERGYTPDEISFGVNWAYMTSGELDPMVILILVIGSIIILASGYLIIYSVFSISVTGDIKFYGLLKTIGATGKQLRRIVRGQAVMLSAAGIPLGFLIGFVLGYALTPVITESSALRGMESVSVNPLIFAFAGIFSLVTVFISCAKPGKIAAKVSPVEAVRYTEAKSGKRREKKSRRVTPVSMALSNITRSKGKLAVVVASLSLSVIILNSVYSMANGFDMELYLSNQMSTDFLVSHYSVLSPITIDDNIEGIDADIREEISSLEGLEGSADIWFYDDIQPGHTLSPQGHSNINALLDEQEEYILEYWPHTKELIKQVRNDGIIPMHIYGIGKLAAEEISEDIDFKRLSGGNYVIATEFGGSDNQDKNAVKSVYQTGEKVTLTNEKGETREFEVIGVTESYNYSMSIQHSHMIESEIIMADNIFRSFYGNEAPMTTVFNIEEEYIPAAQQWIDNYIENVNPDIDYRSLEYYKGEFESFRSMYVIMGGVISFILAMIGILNFINSVFTSITARRCELAMLQSVGMTGGQLKTMLFSEGTLYAVITVIASLTLGTPVAWLIVHAMTADLWFFKWNFTVMPTVIAIPVLLAVCALIPLICYRIMQKESIVERLRHE